MDRNTGAQLREQLADSNHVTEFHTISMAGHHIYVDNSEEFNRVVIASSLAQQRRMNKNNDNNNNNEASSYDPNKRRNTVI